ncbi:MAG: HPF/RaiA family ribosome-associated protein [Aeriscardovia sp.]|nr:HPF/RaiA family ribosome-associated protein [Aeriscardovia sp.]
MDVEITARRVRLSAKFKEVVNAKLGKAAEIAPDAQTVHVVVTSQPNPAMAQESRSVEITVFAGKDCIRADAASDTDVAAFDEALDRLVERLRRFRGKKRSGRTEGASEGPGPEAAAPEEKAEASGAPAIDAKVKSEEGGEELIEAHLGDAVFEVRRKIHAAEPMDVDEAIYRMELLGHDFFLFVDKETGNPSCLYRRHAMSYGVLELKNN